MCCVYIKWPKKKNLVQGSSNLIIQLFDQFWLVCFHKSRFLHDLPAVKHDVSQFFYLDLDERHLERKFFRFANLHRCFPADRIRGFQADEVQDDSRILVDNLDEV